MAILDTSSAPINDRQLPSAARFSADVDAHIEFGCPRPEMRRRVLTDLIGKIEFRIPERQFNGYRQTTSLSPDCHDRQPAPGDFHEDTHHHTGGRHSRRVLCNRTSGGSHQPCRPRRNISITIAGTSIVSKSRSRAVRGALRVMSFLADVHTLSRARSFLSGLVRSRLPRREVGAVALFAER